MDPLAWPAILLFVGLALLVLEIFVPSGGILGFLSLAAMAAGIALAFYQVGVKTGFSFLAITMVAVPTVLVFAFRWWPSTPMGRRMLPAPPSEEEIRPDSPERRLLRDLVGKYGHARTVMLPSGAVEIEGRTIDAVSEGMPIDPGQPIQVVEVRDTRVVVRLVEDIPEQQAQQQSRDPNDILSRPFDSTGFDPFDDPLA